MAKSPGAPDAVAIALQIFEEALCCTATEAADAWAGGGANQFPGGIHPLEVSAFHGSLYQQLQLADDSTVEPAF
jgi:hypothetical protein